MMSGSLSEWQKEQEATRAEVSEITRDGLERFWGFIKDRIDRGDYGGAIESLDIAAGDFPETRPRAIQILSGEIPATSAWSEYARITLTGMYLYEGRTQDVIALLKSESADVRSETLMIIDNFFMEKGMDVAPYIPSLVDIVMKSDEPVEKRFAAEFLHELFENRRDLAVEMYKKYRGLAETMLFLAVDVDKMLKRLTIEDD